MGSLSNAQGKVLVCGQVGQSQIGVGTHNRHGAQIGCHANDAVDERRVFPEKRVILRRRQALDIPAEHTRLVNLTDLLEGVTGVLECLGAHVHARGARKKLDQLGFGQCRHRESV